ncbi:hypothetical protein [Flavobacterium filum]|uniref:hypothetical protein n=1 Tax=Flavobacterium filum TaxID=370974 RepID=UPI0023F1FEC7|nr:hypothetical protein [Flavobacterium filum]
MSTIYYFYLFRDNNVTYYLPIRKEIPNCLDVIPDYYDNQLFQQLRQHFKEVRIEGHFVYEDVGKDVVDRYLKSYEKANQKELTINQIYYQLNSEHDERRIVRNSHIAYYFSDENSISLKDVDIEVCDRAYYLRLRNSFRPSEIKAIFLLEAPPKSGKYFYDVRGEMNEPLFNEMMKAFNIKATSKADGLSKFRDKGLFIVDATYNHVDDIKSNTVKTSTILRDNENLLRDLEILDREEYIPIILIKVNIYDIYKDRLIDLNFNVVNGDNRIPFPANHHQTEFQGKLKVVLEQNNLY